MTRLDTRVVYGATCAWWDTIDKVAVKGGRGSGGLPCCPQCGSVLFEVESEAKWWADVDAHEAAGHHGYRGFVEWLRGRCYPGRPGLEMARLAYEAQRDG